MPSAFTCLARPVALAGLVAFVAGCGSSAPVFEYPATRATDHVDTYHGTAVPDPYRWLEDDTSDETAAWVQAQNAVTFAHLEQIPFRQTLKARLERLYDYERYSAPSRKGDHFIFSKNDGLQNQSVLYIQRGLDGEPEVLLDPNTWSEDGTVRLTAFELSADGRHAVYGVSRSGSDWQEYNVLEIATKTPRPDTIEWIKVSSPAWFGDGFFYSRYPVPEAGRELSSANEDHQVYYHRLGTSQADDELVYRDAANPQRFHGVRTTDDERFAILTISDRGTGRKGNSVHVRNLARGATAFTPLIGEITDDTFDVIDNDGDALLVYTNRQAPNGRVVRIDPARPEESAWVTVLAERPEPLDRVTSAGGRLFATYLKDVTGRVFVHRFDGTLEHEVALPGLGTVGGFDGNRDDTFVFYTFTSFTAPPAIYRYDLATRGSAPFRQAEIPGFDPDRFETTQVFFPSKDGTQIPMFLVHRKGLTLNGQNPTLMYGYGGFNITTAPAFNPLRLALLEQGVVYASVNMRGGGEYGEAWHEAGTKLKKQNVFDDFIAAAEWLIAERYTSSEKLAIQGGSNGGLLVGAVMNQRPELFRVAIPQVGVMDMLRFHKFTIGWNWIADYGSSDTPGEFTALHAYSPLHNIRQGVTYPATLITTADHDDRVVPAHSFKYAATLQAAADPGRPALIRIETASGHGASSTAKQIETTADIYAFVLYHLGVTPAGGAQ
ncbi:MAG: prolyl oligopeptidase family serine peptidase [Vicinamibacterales bacterium]|nr:prolyl oligopeptidase family serine peptidase [Vicinamibacterales bacterium]